MLSENKLALIETAVICGLPLATGPAPNCPLCGEQMHIEHGVGLDEYYCENDDFACAVIA